MQFAYTILYVNDVKQSLAFYEKAFGMRTRFLHESGDYGELETGGTALAFSSRALMRQLGKEVSSSDPHHPNFEIAMVSEDVAAAVHTAVEAGATLMQAPKEMPWGQTIAYVADCDGVLVEICTSMQS